MASRVLVSILLMASFCMYAVARGAAASIPSRGLSRGASGGRKGASSTRSSKPKAKSLGAAPAPNKNLQAPQKLEADVCAPVGYRELPDVRVPPMKCKRFFDWSPLAIAGVNLQDTSLLLKRDVGTLEKLEVLLLQSNIGWTAPTDQLQKQLWSKFTGSNHFIVYSKDDLTLQESYNRLVQMASSDVVALVRPGDEQYCTAAVLQSALSIMGRHERMAMLSLGTGWRDGSIVALDQSRTGWAYVDAVASGPVFVKRTAFLEVGLFWKECNSNCFELSLLDLSLRMWEGGYTVAITTTAGGGTQSPSGTRKLQEVGPSNAQDSGFMPYWLKKLKETPEEEETDLPDIDEIIAAADQGADAEAAEGGEEEAEEQHGSNTEAEPEGMVSRSHSGKSKQPKAAEQKLQRSRNTTWSSTMSVFIGPPSRPEKPVRPLGWRPSIEEKEANTSKGSPGSEPCKGDIQASLRANKARLQSASIARAWAAADVYFDTVDALEPNHSFTANSDRLSRPWGDIKSRASPEQFRACSAVLQDVREGHRCTFEAAQTAMILQYFKRSQNIKVLSEGIATTTEGLDTELLINNDSRSDLQMWLTELKQARYKGNVFVSMSPNIHEIRGYNRLSKFTTAQYLAHLQDDDVPQDPNWLKHALILYSNLPKLAVLGGLRGRMDYGTIMDTRSNYINGPKFGAPSAKRGCCKKILHWEPTSKIPFMFMYKVNLSPFILRRDRFLEMGMYHHHFSCAGDPGIGLDFELSIRAWRFGLQTGLYYSNFKLQVGASRETGTRSSEKLFQRRRDNELRNNKMMYTMYKGFHHKKGNGRAGVALKSLPAVKGWEPFNDLGGTRDFLKAHRGWYMSNKLKSSNARASFNSFYQEVLRKGKGT